MDDDCNQGKDDYSDIQDPALGSRCVRYLMRKLTVYVRSRRTDHYNIIFLLEHSSVAYIYVVEYSECFITDAHMFWSCEDQWCSCTYGHQTLQTAYSDRGIFTDDVALHLDRRVQNIHTFT